jgi:hypothetical protein
MAKTGWQKKQFLVMTSGSYNFYVARTAPNTNVLPTSRLGAISRSSFSKLFLGGSLNFACMALSQLSPSCITPLAPSTTARVIKVCSGC